MPKIKRHLKTLLVLLLLIAVSIFLLIQNETDPELTEMGHDRIELVTEVEEISVELDDDNAFEDMKTIDELLSDLNRPLADLPTIEDGAVAVVGGKIEIDKPLVVPESEENLKKINFTYGVDDATGNGSVRAIRAKAGVDLAVDERTTIGVEVGRKIHDSQDASAWGRKTKDKNEGKIEATLAF